ncbi:MAG TPA: hypothetical protein VKD02_04060 [Methyloceanibacter sp.]|nr:hypothetical protein [Methyloceanibacter sp.]
MDQHSPAVRGALIGAIVAFSILSALLVAACAVKQPYDFPAMRLTTPTTADADTRR